MATPDQRVQRKLAAIFAADVAGYSRLVGSDEVGTLRLFTAHRKILDGLIAEHRGRIANTAGDSVLAEFPSAVDAVQCAVEAQQRLAVANESLPADRRLEFRIGVHVGDVVVQPDDLFGDGVNIAARLQALAPPGGVCISGAVSTPNYQASRPRKTGGLGDRTMPPEACVEEALEALGRQPYVIPGRMNRLASFIMRYLMPRRLAIQVMGRVLHGMYGK